MSQAQTAKGKFVSEGRRVGLLVGVSMMAMAAASPAAAQAAAEAATRLDEVVVTARKVEENLQEVPVSVTVLSGRQLEQQGAVNVSDIAQFTPGFTTRESPSNPTAFVLSIRGQVQTDILATLEPSVGVYLDGVYVARAYGLNTEMLDLQSVQVLKGPQGTLFGRNTTGGAVLLQTAAPVLGETSGSVHGSYGRFNERVGSAVVNVPVGDSLAVRGAFRFDKRDGYVENTNSAARYNDRDSIQGRLKVLWEPTEGVSLLLGGEWYDGETNGPVRFNRFAGPTWAAVPGIAAEQAGYLADEDTARPSIVPYTKVQTQTYTGTLSVDVGVGELKWINGYRKVSTDNAVDLDGAFFNRHVTLGAVTLKQWSTELQLTGDVLDGAIDYAVGATYFHEEGLDASRSQANGAPTWTAFAGEIDNDSVGIYGQAGWHVTDKLTVTGGLRYSEDEKQIETLSAVFLNNVLRVACLPTTVSPTTGCLRGRSDKFDAISYTAGVDYRLSDDVMVYAKTSRGYRSGAQQLRTLTLFDSEPAQPETVHEHEVGLKSEFLERRLRLNAAAYYNRINGAQRSTLQAIGGVAQTLLENANIRNYGVEADVTFLVTPELTLTAAGSLNDPKYRSYIGYINGVPGVDKSSARFDAVPKKQFTLAANYERDLGEMRLAANVSWSWVGKTALSSESFETLTGSGYSAANANLIIAATEKPAAGLVNARVALRFGEDDRYEAALWGRNILNERYTAASLFVGGANDYVSSLRNDPATYGVSATVRF